MPLIDPTPLDQIPDPEQLGPVHFIAIGGSGMNGIATIFAQRGIEVSGSDRSDSDYLQSLAGIGVRTHVGHAAEQLGNARSVVASSAIREDNPELAEARRRGLPLLHRSVALTSLMKPGLAGSGRVIAVAGTHGKTTTTAMTAHLLTELGADPSYVIGGVLYHPGEDGAKRPSTSSGHRAKTGGHLGAGPDFVVEADESDGTFRQYPTKVAVITNIDPDHLVNWGSAENYRAGFEQFATGSEVELVVISADDPGAVALTERLRSPEFVEGHPAEIVTFGRSEGADIRITDESYADLGSSFTLTDSGQPEGSSEASGPVRLVVPGSYNALNAATAYAIATRLGHDPVAVRDGLAGYPGTYRRFQLVGSARGIRVFDDYAHHPTEVANTVRAAREAVDEGGAGRLVAVMQPHLYSRTRDFWREFGAALEPADEAIVMDVCGDREDPIDGITGRLVADAVPANSARVTYEPDWDATAATVARIARPGDLVITLGCGDVTKIAPRIVAELDKPEGE